MYDMLGVVRVSVIIPNYNGKNLLAKNLPVILKVMGIEEVVVVDDGSTDGSAEYLKREFPKVKLIEKVTNSGFSTTVNLGIKATDADVIVLLNTDVIPRQDFLTPLLAQFKDPQVFAVGCLDESIEDTGMVKRGRGVGKFTRGFLQHACGEVDRTDTLWVNGGSGAFRKIIWEELGGMDEIYNPFYWEDIDLSYRAQKAGYKVLFEPKSVVIHRHNEGAINSFYTGEQIKIIAYRNQFLFVWKNITDTNLVIQHLLWLPYHKLRALLRGDWPFWRGFFQALLKLPEVLRKRRYQDVVYKKSDAEVLSRFANEL